MSINFAEARWVKSSYSQTGGNCIEWAPAFAAQGVVPVRDSKNPGVPPSPSPPRASPPSSRA